MRGIRRTALAALLASSGLAAPAIAQSLAVPPRFQTVDGNGVDLVSDTYVAPFVEGVAGSGKGAVSIVRNRGGPDQWSGLLYRTSIGGIRTMVVQFGPIADTFTQSGSTWVPTKANGATLATTGNLGEWRYAAPDGTKILYNSIINHDGGLLTQPYQIAGPGCGAADPDTCAIPLSISAPDGLEFTLDWDFARKCNPPNTLPCQDATAFFRFKGPTSSAGYHFARTYLTDNPGAFSAPVPDWYQRTGAVFGTFTVTYAHPSSGVEQLTDGAGRVWTFTYAADGSFHFRRPGSATDNIVVTFNPANGTVTSVTNDGVTTYYARAVAGTTGTITTTDPVGHHRTIVADLNLGRVTAITDELGRTISYAYDANARLTKATSPEGNYTQYAYDARGNVKTTTQVAKPGSGLASIVTSASFDSACGNVVTCNQPNSTTDATGNVTNYTYDPTHGGLLTVTRPAPSAGAARPQTRYGYTAVTSAAGAPVTMLTSAKACPTGSTCAPTDEISAAATYNANLLPASVTRGNSSGTLAATDRFTYDPVGNLITVDGPLPGTADTTRLRYDAARELVGLVSPDPDGAGPLPDRAVRYQFDPAGQLWRTDLGTVVDQSDPAWANFAEAFHHYRQFDSDGRVIRETLWSNGVDYAVADHVYDVLGRLSCTVTYMDPAQWGPQATTCAPLQTNGPNGPDRVSQAIYDAAGEVTQVLSGVGTPDAATERTLSYTANGMLATLKDAQNNLTTWEYDGFDRLAKTRYPVPTKGSGTSSTTDYEQLGYDPNGNVVSRRLRDGRSIAYAYDALNRRTLMDVPTEQGVGDVTYTYDNLGRPTLIGEPGNTMTLAWDALSRLAREGQAFGHIDTQYDLAGRRTRATWWDGFYVQYDRLVTGELLHVRENGATSGVGVLASYGYDGLGNRASRTFGNGVVQAYTFDPVSRLARLTNNLPGTANDLTATFAYNPAGQIVNTTRSNDAYVYTAIGSGSTASTANGLNQLTTIGGVATSHDARGNLTFDPASGKSYGYSAGNILTSAPGSATLYYDPLRRLGEYDTNVSTRFVYDGASIAAEVDNPAGAIQHRYVRGDGIDELLVDYVGSGTANRRFLSTDERGSVISATGSSGNLIAIDTYDEYGKPGASNIGRFQFTGQAWFAEVGAYDYKNRNYLPGSGRFPQTDPIGTAGGINLYAYVGNDPVNLTDPLGLASVECHGQWVYAAAVNDPDAPLPPIGDPGWSVMQLCSIVGASQSGGGESSTNPGASRGGGQSRQPQQPMTPNTRQCSTFQRSAEHVADLFGSAASDATNLALITGIAGGANVAIGDEPGAALLLGASAHFGSQAAVYGAISGVASILSGNSAKAISDQLTNFALKKVAPFIPEQARAKIADQLSAQGPRCE